MLHASKWKVGLVVLAAIFGILFTIPNLLPAKTLASLPKWVPAKTLNLGLDLQGGSSLLLEADLPSLKRERLSNLLEDIRNELNSVPIKFSNLGIAGDSVSVTIGDPSQMDDAFKRMNRLTQAASSAQRDLNATKTGQVITFTSLPEAQATRGAKAVEQSIEIVRRRIDKLGTTEPSIVPEGKDRIRVEAPGEANPERLKSIIGQTAKLTFQMVDDTVSVQEAQAGAVPPGSELLPMERNPNNVELVRKRSVVDGEMLTSATSEFDENNQPAVGFRFNAQGARRFGQATTDNIGKRFAIVLDRKVISAPVIQTAITGGSGRITNMGTVQDANDLALLLNAGALPVKLNPVSQSTVGATLGADAVKAGAISTLVGFVAIVVFMLLAYGFVFGGVSVVALTLNVLMIVGAMSLFHATLTLPGVAGLILTLAVAVDANVLIYERIRDEERSGHPPVMAIETGFRRAWVSIFDANVTSLISAMIMFSFGSGPVKGFALTLAIGVVTSVFTAMLVSQVLLGMWFRAVRPKALPI